MPSCTACARRFRSRAAYEAYQTRTKLHEALAIETGHSWPLQSIIRKTVSTPSISYSGVDDRPTKRERHLQDSREHRMGQR